MSASSKKKLRNEQNAAKLTEKQLAEQKEAKKLKLYTTIFVAVIAVMLVIAIGVGVSQAVSNSGIREKNTVAMTVGEHEISNAQLSYYYIDTIQNFYNQYYSYLYYFGLDTTQPLDEQVYDSSTGETWADYFLSSAMNSVQSIYAMYDAAVEAGFTLPEEDQTTLENSIATAELYATLNSFSDVDAYLQAMYGSGASEEGYREYMEVSLLADAYYVAYGDSLTYEDADLRAAEADNYNAYSAFSYNYYYLNASKFLEGGTTDEEGTTTYSDEEKAASVAAAEAAAKALTSDEITSVSEFDTAIAELSINAEATTSTTSTVYTDYNYANISSVLVDWISDASRKEGDKTYIANESTTTDEDNNEVTTINGYYVLYFVGSTDNNFAMKNARHILVEFETTTDETTGESLTTEEDKAAAKATAEEILLQWKTGDATEESFAALANEKSSDTGSNTNGGLYENIYPNQMVDTFEDWCYDESRKPGDTGIIETDYGYHVMYFVGDSELTYRDYMIQNDLISNDVSEWYASLLEATPMEVKNTSYIAKDLVLSNG